MDMLQRFLDWVAGAPPPVVQEADRENMRYDKTRLDTSLGRMLAANNEFTEIVAQVVRDVSNERRHRRAHAKTTSRAGKA